MRAVDGVYIYNLQVPTKAIVNDLFTIMVWVMRVMAIRSPSC